MNEQTQPTLATQTVPERTPSIPTPHRDSPHRRPPHKGFEKRPRTSFRRPSSPRPAPKTQDSSKIPPIGDSIRIIPLGGVEEIGRNMTAIEFGDDIIVVDAGFQFKDEETPGIDYILPNTKYLEEHQEKIRALFITHGHLDHIGGVPLVLSRIGNPQVYSRQLSMLMMRKRQAEFPQLPAMKENIVEKTGIYRKPRRRASRRSQLARRSFLVGSG